MNLKRFVVPEDTVVDLSDYSTSSMGPYRSKDEAEEKLQADIRMLADWQAKLYAQSNYGLLIVLQGIDAAGKDSIIKHVMSGVNPTGCQVKSFKAPSEEEQRHDYLWRCVRALPERGHIGIFNRSYYEEVLVVRVHPELLSHEHVRMARKHRRFWHDRFRQINHFERYLVENGFEILKFFLHLSKAEQKQRFLARIDAPDKNWKFQESDVDERGYWHEYQRAYADMLSHTSTRFAPWHVIPADNKWFAQLAVADTVVSKLAGMNLDYPRVDGRKKRALAQVKKRLESEK